MNPLSSLLTFFRKKPSTPSGSTEANETQASRLQDGYNAFEAGIKHGAEERIQQALDCFDTATECGFEDEELYGLRGSCLQALEWHLDAIDDFNKAITLKPEDCNLFFQRAMSKNATGDLQGFRADIQEAIRLSKVDNALNCNYNLIAKDMGRKSPAALYQWQAVMSDMPDSLASKRIESTKLRGRRKDKPK